MAPAGADSDAPRHGAAAAANSLEAALAYPAAGVTRQRAVSESLRLRTGTGRIITRVLVRVLQVELSSESMPFEMKLES